MSEHRATVEWSRNGVEFRYETYPRTHEMRFDNISLKGNAAPGNIPATVLWFLHIACRAGYVVDRYVDDAVGVLDRTWMSQVTLRPKVTFLGKNPDSEEHRALHRKAHEKCFIANSVRTEVRVEPC
jgi:hypothetical protein